MVWVDGLCRPALIQMVATSVVNRQAAVARAGRGFRGVVAGSRRERALNVALNNSQVGGDWDLDKLRDLVGGLTALPEFDVRLHFSQRYQDTTRGSAMHNKNLANIPINH